MDIRSLPNNSLLIYKQLRELNSKFIKAQHKGVNLYTNYYSIFNDKTRNIYYLLRLLVFDPWLLSKIVFQLKLMQRKTLNLVINLPDVENITK